MKKILLSVICMMVLSVMVSAQRSSGTLFKDKIATGIDIFNDLVMDAPDGIKFRGFNPGVNIYAMHNFPIGESSFAFAAGLGLGMHNMFSNSILKDTSGVSFLSKIPTKTTGGEDLDYKKSKISLTYVDVPAELRFKTESGFRVALGFKVGYLINAHTKYKGDDLEDGSKTKIKVSQLPNFQTWRFGPTMQIGYKWVNLTGFYSVSKVFEENFGPGIYPISLGLSLRPF
ncbi:MAG: PorT family protein [Lentimicrobium sp.]|nr:PorT family protein [Lentimicrobium sp.]